MSLAITGPSLTLAGARFLPQPQDQPADTQALRDGADSARSASLVATVTGHSFPPRTGRARPTPHDQLRVVFRSVGLPPSGARLAVPRPITARAEGGLVETGIPNPSGSVGRMHLVPQTLRSVVPAERLDLGRAQPLNLVQCGRKVGIRRRQDDQVHRGVLLCEQGRGRTARRRPSPAEVL